MPSLRFVRIAQLTALIADVLTIFCAVLVVGWQMIIFIKDGSWPALPLSLAFRTQGSSQAEVYTTASIDKIAQSSAANITDTLLQMPIIALLILAAALLTTFYLWLSSVEKEFAKIQVE